MVEDFIFLTFGSEGEESHKHLHCLAGFVLEIFGISRPMGIKHKIISQNEI
jgi:hypothetical protein